MGQQCCFKPSDIWYIRWNSLLILIGSCWKCTDQDVLNMFFQLFVILRLNRNNNLSPQYYCVTLIL